VVDPLDGTINFAHGFPLWCVSIGLEHAGELVVGVVHVPPLGTTYRAAKGLGATLDGRPLHVSGAGSLSESLIATGLPTDFASDADRQMALMRRFSTGTHSLRRTGTTAWNLAQVAAGGCEVCYATHVYPWDVAAGIVLIREAGGLVTALDGSPYVLEGPTILATNSRVHAEAGRAVVEAWPG
jgi:myo-inositol-1(or 4)-monophosphatase